MDEGEDTFDRMLGCVFWTFIIVLSGMLAVSCSLSGYILWNILAGNVSGCLP